MWRDPTVLLASIMLLAAVPEFVSEAGHRAPALLKLGGDTTTAERIFPEDPNAPNPIQQNAQPAASDHRAEMGQLFTVSVEGKATSIRFPVAAAERGDHVARLWRVTDGLQMWNATIPGSQFEENDTAVRWLQWPVLPPVHLQAGPEYIVTVSGGTETLHHWAGCPTCWMPAGTNNRHISWPEASARFCFALGTMPTTVPQGGESYLRDVVFCADAEAPCTPNARPPLPPRAATINLAGPSYMLRPSAVAGTTIQRGYFKAALLDKSGKAITAAAYIKNVTWKLQSTSGKSPNGATVVATPEQFGPKQWRAAATVVVGSSLASDASLVLEVCLDGVCVSRNLQVAANTEKNTFPTVTGPAAVRGGVASTLQYTAKSHNLLQQPADEPHGYTWSLGESKAGVTINVKTGAVRVTSAATDGMFFVYAHQNGHPGQYPGMYWCVCTL
jgi:hypothetical protein